MRIKIQHISLIVFLLFGIASFFKPSYAGCLGVSKCFYQYTVLGNVTCSDTIVESSFNCASYNTQSACNNVDMQAICGNDCFQDACQWSGGGGGPTPVCGSSSAGSC